MRRHMICLALSFAPAGLATPSQASPSVASAPALASDAVVERTRFTVHVTGTGPDVILVPGLASPASVWQPTVDRLRDRYRLHVIQVRGFGDAPGVNADGPVLDPLVADLTAYVREAGLVRPAMIGHSMGGLTAAIIAAREPDLLGRVLIQDSLPFIGLLFSPAATVDAVRPQAEAMLPVMLAAGQQPADARTLQAMSATQAGRDQVAAWGMTADYRVTARLFHDVLITDIRPELARITVPVTVLYPHDDDVAPIAVVDALYTGAYSQLAGARLIRVSDSRHFIMLDQPVRFAAEVDAFLGDHSGG